MQVFTPLIAAGLLALYFMLNWPRQWRYWLAPATMVLAYPFLFGSIFNDARLAWSGERTVGTVLAASCGSGKQSNSVTLSYRFDADGLAMVGNGPSGQGNPNCGIKVGDPVHISYLPREPNVSAAVKNPALALLWKFAAWLAVVLLLIWMKSEHGERTRENMRNFSFRRP
jgi:hypothetical protein